MTKLTELLIHQLLYFWEKLYSFIWKVPGGPKDWSAPLMMGIQRAGMVTAEKGILIAFLIVILVPNAGKSHIFPPCITPQTPFSHHTKWKVISVLGQSMRVIDTSSSVSTGISTMNIYIEWTWQDAFAGAAD